MLTRLKAPILVAGLVIGSSAPAAAQAEPESLSLKGTGTIVVVTEPAEEATFMFSFPFAADIGASVRYGVAPGDPWTESRPPGSYVVKLVDGLGANWEVTDITCVDGGGPTPSSGDVQARTATFGIDPGEDVTCTFTLSQGHGTIAVETDPPGGDVDYEFRFPFPPNFGGAVRRTVDPSDPWREKRAARHLPGLA